MSKTALIYGPIAGCIIIFGIIASIEFNVPYQWLGYLIMLIAFSAIYVAIQRFRDEQQGGVISFAKGFQVGLGVTVIASLIYVFGWELYLLLTDYAFVTDYTESVLEAERSSGMGAQEMAALEADMEALREQYSNILFRIALSSVEIFPVGILVSLISAALNKTSK